ncbi:hypothetical protein A3Q56_05376 [Intoshia linei]|uniref:Uncharacterized protein n=1 Tax=Intoshia linei TaxID=1819745 RepID=A0A177AZU6_9BILA|nr:hypothetical protein A3Q56_05376 [Intoshia linei]
MIADDTITDNVNKHKNRYNINFSGMNNAKYTQRELSIKFGMPLGAINKILKNKDSLKQLKIDGIEDKRMLVNFATAEIDKLVYE